MECRSAARFSLTRSHINSVELASVNGEKRGCRDCERECRRLRIRGGMVERALEKAEGLKLEFT